MPRPGKAAGGWHDAWLYCCLQLAAPIHLTSILMLRRAPFMNHEPLQWCGNVSNSGDGVSDDSRPPCTAAACSVRVAVAKGVAKSGFPGAKRQCPMCNSPMHHMFGELYSGRSF